MSVFSNPMSMKVPTNIWDAGLESQDFMELKKFCENAVTGKYIRESVLEQHPTHGYPLDFAYRTHNLELYKLVYAMTADQLEAA